jgi:hypothetical protein
MAFRPLGPLSHLSHSTVDDSFKRPKAERELRPYPKVYRIVLNSADRIAGTRTIATFNVPGNLTGDWSLDRNLDAGARHFTANVSSFHLACATAAPALLEVLGEGHGLEQSESWDSSNDSSSHLLTVASGALTAWSDGSSPQCFTLHAIPSGAITISLRTRDAAQQTALDADTSLVWVLVLTIIPSE